MATNPNDPSPELRARLALRAKYQRIIDELWTNQPDVCPVCSSTAWSVADLIQTPVRMVSPDMLGFGGEFQNPQVYVYVPVTCLQCGYTRFFHSGVLDVRDAEEIKSRKPLHLPKDAR